MKVNIQDRDALLAVSPIALSAYARAAGWSKVETFGDYSDVYDAEGLPEIILPRIDRLGDYAKVVSQLIGIFADVAKTDTLSLYHDLITVEYDVIRVRAVSSSEDGSIAVNEGLKLLNGAWNMLRAAAFSLHSPKPVYFGRHERFISDYLRRVKLGHTEQGSYVIKLLSPIIIQDKEPDQRKMFEEDPIERKMTLRLTQALEATREVLDRNVGENQEALFETVKRGASANLCNAVATAVDTFSELSVSLTWALTYPRESPRYDVQFKSHEPPLLKDVAKKFKAIEPQLDKSFFGYVQILDRDKNKEEGTVTLNVDIQGRTTPVSATLMPSDYGQAIQAHITKSEVCITGDLIKKRNSWLLQNPRIINVIVGENENDLDEQQQLDF